MLRPICAAREDPAQEAGALAASDAIPESWMAALEPVLRGRIVVDSVNPLGFDQRGPFALAVPDALN